MSITILAIRTISEAMQTEAIRDEVTIAAF
jgi:hypothetical protein